MISSKKMSKKSSKYQETSSIANNFSKFTLIFAFSIILAENKYIFTYLIRISIKMTRRSRSRSRSRTLEQIGCSICALSSSFNPN